MKFAVILRSTLVVLASLGMLLPQLAFGAGTTQSGQRVVNTAVRDIALQDGGVLKGQVLDTQGTPVPGIPVAIVLQGKPVATTNTGPDGTFLVADLNSGVYQIVTAQGSAAYRLWAPRTAPPAATASALIVNGSTVVRGGQGGGPLRFLANPWVLGGIVAAAIALPLVLDDDDAS